MKRSMLYLSNAPLIMVFHVVAFKEWKCKVHFKLLKIGEKTSAEVAHTKEGRFTVAICNYYVYFNWCAP